jgi:hypothetical protein
MARIWKESVVNKFEVIIWNVSGVKDEATKSLSLDNRLPGLNTGFIGCKVTTVRTDPTILK